MDENSLVQHRRRKMDSAANPAGSAAGAMASVLGGLNALMCKTANVASTASRGIESGQDGLQASAAAGMARSRSDTIMSPGTPLREAVLMSE